MADLHIANFDTYPLEKEDKTIGLVAKYFPNPDGGSKGVVVNQVCPRLTMEHVKNFQEDLEQNMQEMVDEM
jgi:hypothetical protein